MNYFKGITDLEKAKLHYRKLAKQLHPDKGGTTNEFQNMQNEYKVLFLKLQQKHNIEYSQQQASTENELLSELGVLAKMLIKNQIPQKYLRQKVATTESPLKKELFSDIADLLDCL
ncbi:MAG: J domain-containing protein [Bacteroidales bacterium]|nr:J domain-containing protein [Bacteroidales bacterium]